MGFHGPHILRALQTGQFEPYFQPLITLQTGKLAGFAVLARWKHPEMGMIPPETFVAMAEREGWIGALTEEILRKSLLAISALPEPLPISINVSPLQLRDFSLPKQMREIAEETDCSLEWVMVELTETALAEDLDQAREIAFQLKSLGCKIALDDFGKGYSSLCHLQSLPFDELKVDRSFVSSMTDRRESRKIVAAVVGLGQSLGLKTVAEGVETQEQADILHWLGCDIGQGWLFGRPVPASELPQVIRAAELVAAKDAGSRWNRPPVASLEGLPSQRLAQLQAVYDGAPCGLAFLDRNLRYVNINSRLADMHRASVEGHVGKSLREMVPHLAPQVEPCLNRALNGECVTDVEIIEIVESGTARTYLASYQPVRDEAGEVVGVSCAVLDFTARKAAEVKLHQFERVLEGLEEMVVVVDRNYHHVLANRAFLKFHGMEADQLKNLLVEDVVGRQVFESAIKPKFDECMQGNSVYFEMKYDYPAAGERELAVSYAPVEMSGGIAAVACVLRDVTEWKRMRRQEQNWEQRIELAQQSGLRIGFWEWNMEANTVVWSDETYRQWGFTREEFRGRVEDAVRRIHPDDFASTEESMRKARCEDCGQFAAEYRVLRPDGTVCWLDAHGVILRDEPTRMIGVGVDVTDLRRTQQSLMESEQKYLLLLNSTAQAIFGIDLDGNCTFCNPACLRALGFERPEDLMGRNMHQLVHHTRSDGSTYPMHQCGACAAIREGRDSHVTDEVLWRADGTSFPVEYWSYPMHVEGKLVGAVVTFLNTARPTASHSDKAKFQPYGQPEFWPQEAEERFFFRNSSDLSRARRAASGL